MIELHKARAFWSSISPLLLFFSLFQTVIDLILCTHASDYTVKAYGITLQANSLLLWSMDYVRASAHTLLLCLDVSRNIRLIIIGTVYFILVYFCTDDCCELWPDRDSKERNVRRPKIRATACCMQIGCMPVCQERGKWTDTVLLSCMKHVNFRIWEFCTYELYVPTSKYIAFEKRCTNPSSQPRRVPNDPISWSVQPCCLDRCRLDHALGPVARTSNKNLKPKPGPP